MTLLAIDQLSKNFGARTIFDSISYRFPENEKIALVGPNGAGKTTLLNVLTGLEAADGGQVLRSQGLKLGYLPQEPNPEPLPTVVEECLTGHHRLYELKVRMEQELELLQSESSDQRLAAYEKAETEFRMAGGYSLESKASGILSGLGFDALKQAQDPRSLSGGWRMRLELAKVFINDPDVLILDEPTNHLDLPSLVWVERYLQTFRGTLLFVSHDRALLNRLATSTLLLSHGRLRAYKGNFDQMLDLKEMEEQQNESRRQNLERQREQLETFVERFGAKASKARQAQSKSKQIDRLRVLEGAIESTETLASLHLKLPEAPPSGRDALLIKDLAIGYQKPLATGINLLMERGARIAIIGSNGIGKSTLLKTIAGHLEPLDGGFKLGHQVKIAYCAQNHEDILNYERSILENILDARAELGEKDARQLLGSFLFSGEAVYKPVKVLSGGEKARVGLCKAIVQPSNLLMLDEPTNHLDMSSVEILIEGFKAYSGSLLFVSHDRSFIDQLATHIFVMLPDGRSALFHGKLADYQQLAESQGFPNVLDPSAEAMRAKPSGNAANSVPKKIKEKEADSKPSTQDNEEAKQLRRERSRWQKAMEKTESDQTKLKMKAQALEGELSTVDPSAYVKAQELHRSLQDVHKAQVLADEQWLEAAESLERIEAQLTAMGRQ